jgi:hypothetical protein
MEKTVSEQIFEDFCARRGIVCRHVPEGERKTPDYELVFGEVVVVVEVKEMTPNRKERESDRLARERGCGNAISITPGDRVRKKIVDCSAQIKARTGGTHPSMLVVLDGGRVVGHVDPYNIRVAMYGLEQIYIVAPRVGSGSLYAADIGHGPKRKMTDEHNTSISSIGALWMTGPDATHLHVYHNCFAHVPLDRSLLARHGIPQFEIGEPTAGAASEWREIAVECEIPSQG